MKDLTALLLAGGDSTRFWPLSDKNWFYILGKPVLFHTVSQLVKFGIKTIVIVGNSHNISNIQKLRNEFQKVHFHIIEQTDLRGMGGAVLSAKESIKGKKILILNPADFYEDILLSQLSSYISDDIDGIITGIYSDVYFPGGYLDVTQGYVTSIVEKPDPSHLPSNVVSLVFYYFKQADDLLKSLETVQAGDDNYFEKGVDNLLKEKKFKFLHYKGYWGHLKFPWDVCDVSAYFLAKRKRKVDKSAIIDKSAKIIGDVVLESNVRVLENAKIVGPTFIGAGTIIGNNAVVRQSNVEANCVIGYGTEIARSFIGSNCWFHSNYIGDSIIENNVSMGAGTVLANFKLNETTITSFLGKEKVDTHLLKLGAMIGSNVRIGVNSSIMPGVKIGSNCLISAGVVLSSDIADDMYCNYEKAPYVLEKNQKTINQTGRLNQRKLIKF